MGDEGKWSVGIMKIMLSCKFDFVADSDACSLRIWGEIVDNCWLGDLRFKTIDIDGY